MIKNFKFLLQLIGSFIGLLLLSLQIVNGFSKINTEIFQEFNIWFLFFAIFAAFIALILQIYGWLLLINAIGYELKLKKVVFGYTFTFLPRYIPGTIWGYLTRSEWLLKLYKIPYKDSAFISLVEMIMIFVTNVIIGSYYLPNPYKNFIFLTFFCLFSSSILFKKRYRQKLHKINYYFQLVSKVNFFSGLIIFFIYFLSWFFYGIGLIYTLNAFSIETIFSFHNILLITSINSISWVIGFLVIFIPAGIGVREYTLNFLLMSTLLLPNPISSTISVSYRIITLISEVLLLVFSFILSRKFKIPNYFK